MMNLDDGYISVLGHMNSKNKQLKTRSKIGYMPQETALVDELTVRETVEYFGNLFEMNSEKLRERYEKIRRLLELPPDDFRVENCSGGEKRRVSFAAAIIHEPDLLILDEPTVGLDPLLRERIWDYLWSITRTTKLSVIITTHYIEEAQKSDFVGLMRHGALLAEDSPKNVMCHCNANSLEDAFVALCLKKGSRTDLKFSVNDTLTVTTNPSNQQSDENAPQKKSARNNIFRWQVIFALLCKYFIQFKRQPA